MSLFKTAESNYNQWDIERGLHRKELFSWAEKKAEETLLGDSIDNWQPEIASSAYQQAPYLSDYSVNVLLDKTNPDSNSAYGNLEIKNKFDAPNMNKDDRSVKVPLIVNDKHLKPLDIMSIGGKFSPLSEEKLREALFRPESVELSDRYPSRDRYIGYMSAPPYGGYGTGFTYGADSGMGKFAATDKILDNIKIAEEDKEEIYNIFSSDSQLETAFLKNQNFAKSIDKIASYVELEDEDNVTCIRFEKLNPKQVLVKWASYHNFNPGEKVMSLVEAAKFASLDENSADEIFALEPGNSLSLTTNPVQKNTMDQYEVKEVTEFGEYNVQSTDDEDILGWILPIVTFDNVALPSYIFTNGSVWAFQDKISGSRVGQGNNLPSNKPSGTGVFYSTDSGKAQATIPVDISHSEDGVIIAQDHIGNQLQLEILDVPTLVKLDEGHYAVPSTMKFLRLPEEFISLKSDGATFNKTATMDWTTLSKHAEDIYSIRGYITNREELTKSAAAFILDVAGFNGDVLIKRAEKEKIVKIADGIKLQKTAKVVKKIAHDIKFDKKEILKLASAFSDEDTIDKILSLGVLNSDNIGKYQDFLPHFQETEKKIAELLFAIRCGLSPIEEEPAKLGLGHITRLIKGLKDLKEKDSLGRS